MILGSSFKIYKFGKKKFDFQNIKKKYELSTVNEKKTIKLEDYEINFTSLRLQTFFKKGNSCVKCGRIGKYFKLQKSRKDIKFHLGLWSEDNVQLTKDHIQPKSKGGKNNLKNMQCMCEICNNAKGNINGKINSPIIIYNKYSKFEKYKEELINYQRENNINVFKNLSKFPQFNKHFNYMLMLTKELYEYFEKNPPKKNKIWLKIPKEVKTYF